MSNIIKFPTPKGKQVLPAFGPDAEKIRKAMPKASTVKGVFAGLFLLVRRMFFTEIPCPDGKGRLVFFN